MKTDYDITLLMPCYNEAQRLDLVTIKSYLEKNPKVEIVFVNDGSSDGTSDLISQFSSNISNSRFIDYKVNRGKAHCLRQAFLDISNDCANLVGYWDADLATPLIELENFLDVFKSRIETDYVSGIRLLRLGAPIKRKPLRHYLGRLFATVVSMMLKLPVYDTQCGAKVFKSSLIPMLFKESFVTSWFFDVELLFRMQNYKEIDLHNSYVYELPLTHWKDVDGSKLNSSDFLNTPIELYKIYKKYCK